MQPGTNTTLREICCKIGTAGRRCPRLVQELLGRRAPAAHPRGGLGSGGELHPRGGKAPRAPGRTSSAVTCAYRRSVTCAYRSRPAPRLPNRETDRRAMAHDGSFVLDIAAEIGQSNMAQAAVANSANAVGSLCERSTAAALAAPLHGPHRPVARTSHESSSARACLASVPLSRPRLWGAIGPCLWQFQRCRRDRRYVRARASAVLLHWSAQHRGCGEM
jgi:hypothetical protein